MKYSNPCITRPLVVAFALFGLCTLGPAPLQGQKLGIAPHQNLQKQDENTLQSEQKGGATQMGEVGHVNLGRIDEPVAQQSGAALGANVVANAPISSNPGSEEGKDVLKAANERMESKSSNSWLLTALLVIAVVGAAIFGVKRWADNNIPDSLQVPTPGPKPKNW